MSTENTQPESQAKSATGTKEQPSQGAPRVVSNPNDVANLVLMQIDAVNAKKDELTITVKGLADTAKQLVRAYAQQAAAIQGLNERIKQLEQNMEQEPS